MRRSRRTLLAGLPILMLAGGCGLLGGPSTGAVQHPGGSDVVVRIELTGGFVPYESIFTSMPVLTLLGDGRVIVQGPQIEVYPGPALPNVQVRALTEDGIQTVLHRVFQTGLFDRDRSFTAASQFVADANSTVFTVHADGREVTVDVYALGALGDQASFPPGIPAEEIDAHDLLGSVGADLMNLDAWIQAADWADPSWAAYRPESLRLLVRNVDGVPPDDPSVPSEPMPWPGSTSPDAFGDSSSAQDFRCGVVSGTEADAWYAALEQATTMTRWTDGAHLYVVTPRPLLPDEPLDCATRAA